MATAAIIRTARNASAVCRRCGRVRHLRAGRGARLEEVRCRKCGGPLRAAKREDLGRYYARLDREGGGAGKENAPRIRWRRGGAGRRGAIRRMRGGWQVFWQTAAMAEPATIAMGWKSEAEEALRNFLEAGAIPNSGNVARRRNLFGFGGGGREVITVDEARGRQMEAADSFCKHHEYKQAQRVAKQSPKSWAKAHNLQVEGARHRAARKIRRKAAGALSSWAKRLEGNPDQPAEQLQYYGSYGAVPSAWYQMSARGLEGLRRALLDPNFYAKESPQASAGRAEADLDALSVAIGEARRYGARIFVAHDRHGWYIAREGEPRISNPESRFERLEKKIAREGDAYDPYAVAAAIGIRKYGKKRFEAMAQAGRRRAERRREHRNPETDAAAELEEAADLFERFQGRKPREVLELQASDIERSEFAKLGDLVSLTVLDPEKKKCKLEFGPEDEVIVASSANASQLYILGGNQDVRPLLETLGADGSKDYVELGPLVQIEYFTHKRLDHFQPVRYYHNFGEESGDVPVLAFDQLNIQLLLVGGAYQVKPEGIVN